MRVAALLISCLIAIGACRATEATHDDPDPPVDCILLGPRVSPASARVHPGDTVRATVAFQWCSGGVVVQSDVRWTSNDTTIAAVDSVAGLVRARKQGLATITATLVVDRTLRGAMAFEVVP